MLGQSDLYSQEVVDYEGESESARWQWGNFISFLLAASLFLFLWILCSFIVQSHMTTGYSLLLLFCLTISLYFVQQQYYGYDPVLVLLLFHDSAFSIVSRLGTMPFPNTCW
jgi:uncharacterized membrane protein YoaT (DUF817 family)